MSRKLIVAIDGPAGSGKSTVTKGVSEKLGYVHIDTGALYRAIALHAIEKGMSLDDHSGLGKVAANARLEFRRNERGENRIFLDGDDVSKRIRTPEMSMAASKISAYGEVRAALLGLQRDMGRMGGVVLEGRDIGTVVFPNADVKFFLTASVDSRSKRRQLELEEKGTHLPFEEVRRQVVDRDRDDSQRAVAPLKKAEDALEVDTTSMTIEQVVEHLVGIVKAAEERKG